ncbi:MAG: AAA family ATPase [Bacteroidetes bacterium]|nr:AAA family ATPase [Bacteroidota bacterium]
MKKENTSILNAKSDFDLNTSNDNPRFSDSVENLLEEFKDHKTNPFIWSGIMKGSFGFVYGPPKSGKTIFCENLALAIASGESTFFNIPIQLTRQKTLFISMEERIEPRLERIEKQKKHLKTPLRNNLNLSRGELPNWICCPSEWEILKKSIAESGATFVVIDSLGRLHKGKIEESDVAKEIAIKLRTLTHELKITLLVIHHTPKLNGKPITLDSLAGSRLLAQEADFTFGINRTQDGIRYLKEVSFRYKSEDAETVGTFKINENCIIEIGVRISEDSLLKQSDNRYNDINLQKVFKLIEQLTENGKKTVATQELKDDLVNSGKISSPTFYKHIKTLEGSGKIKKLKKVNIS